MKEINVEFDDKQKLLNKYMPYVIGGGITIEIKETLEMGETVQLNVALLETKDEIQTEAKVISVSSRNMLGNSAYGMQFLGANGEIINKHIENYLVGLLETH